MPDLREQLAAIEHERWADWQRYCHARCTRNPDGSLTIPSDAVERWERQIATAYEDLTEIERDSDREQVDRYWALVDKTSVYQERNKLVAFLSRCYPSYLAPAPDAEPGFEWIVFIETPEGQLSWHLHDDELAMFNHCPRQKPGEWWDGHTTEGKYERLLALRPDRKQLSLSAA